MLHLKLVSVKSFALIQVISIFNNAETFVYITVTTVFHYSTCFKMASLMPIDVQLPSKFLKEPDEKYKCVLCKNILMPPVVQTTCGHRMCQTCAYDLFHDNIDKPVMCCGGEEDCVMLTPNKICSDKAITKELLSLDVFCNNYEAGCTETFPWIKLNVHLETCQFKPVKCDYEGCPLSFPLSMMDAHREKCEFRKIKCSVCNSMLIQKYIEMGHEKQCAELVRPCPLEHFGCPVKGNMKELEKHSAKALLPHNQAIVGILEENTKKQQQLEETLKAMQIVIQDISSSFSSGLTPTSHSSEYKNLLKQVAKLNEDHITTKNTIQGILTHKDLDGIVARVEDFRNVAQIHESRLKNLEQGSANTDDDKVTQTKVRSMERTLAAHDKVLADSEIRIRMIEIATHNGQLLWKISNYRRRKQDAVEGKTLSLYSQSFYSSHFGYKMAARIYLNGDGLGKNTHMSMFFVVMRGEYDALQKWPFRQKVTLILIDQSGTGQHIKDSFRPDLTSTSFRRPTGEMNIAAGCPLFAEHSKVETGQYLRDDTIYIGVEVDTSGLTTPWG